MKALKRWFEGMTAWVRRRMGGWVRFGSEALLAILSVLGCFALFIFVLHRIFPEGDPAKFWFQGEREPSDILSMRGKGKGEKGKVEISLPEKEGKGSAEQGSWETLAARLASTKNDVRRKGADEIVWSRAKEGLSLFDHDAVQTLARSGAVIAFDEKNRIDMDENSLVIVKRAEENRILKERRSFMVVIEGSLRGRIDADGSEKVNWKITTPTAVAEVNTRSGRGRPTDFQIRVNPDQTATVMVYSGVAKIKAQGVTVEVKENQTTHVGLNAPPEAPQPILEPVELLLPAGGAISFYRDFPPEITFSWASLDRADRYRLQVAREASFEEPVLDETTEQTVFLYGNLKAGSYFWRVAPINAPSGIGRWSESREIHVTQKQIPPPLSVVSPKGDETVYQEKFMVEGTTDLDALVYVNGKRVEKDPEGWFREEIVLKKGTNLISVESIDPAGNVRFLKRMVSRKF